LSFWAFFGDSYLYYFTPFLWLPQQNTKHNLRPESYGRKKNSFNEGYGNRKIKVITTITKLNWSEERKHIKDATIKKIFRNKYKTFQGKTGPFIFSCMTQMTSRQVVCTTLQYEFYGVAKAARVCNKKRY
jgi:hypothetical protein